MSTRLRIKLVKSIIGNKERQKRTARALGLRRINSIVVHDDDPIVRGMIERISHLVQVEEVE
jgi:large subunit ribosomal protein L30